MDKKGKDIEKARKDFKDLVNDDKRLKKEVDSIVDNMGYSNPEDIEFQKNFMFQFFKFLGDEV